jgi:hypothetical protein
VQNDRGAHRGRAQEQRVAVRLGTHHRGDADNAAAARPVLDDKGLPDLLADLIEHEPRDDIIGAAGGERAYGQNRPYRPVWRAKRRLAADHRQKAGGHKENQSQIHSKAL